MAGGAPIVASAVGGIPEVLQDGVSGLLVAPSDPPALARALQRILDDHELARALGEAARARQRSEYDLNVVVARLEDLYERCYARVTGRTAARFA
jgi:starch synthase